MIIFRLRKYAIVMEVSRTSFNQKIGELPRKNTPTLKVNLKTNDNNR